MNTSRLSVSLCVLAAALGSPTYAGWTWTTLSYPGATDTWPAAISGNNIVGTYSTDGGNTFRAFLYNGTTWTTLAYPGSTSTNPQGMDGGNIVGTFQEPSLPGHDRGFVRNGSSWTTLNCPGATATYPNGIDGTNIVGSAVFGSAGQNAFRYNGTTWTMLAYPGAGWTWPEDVCGNNIVGTYSADGGNTFRGFLYDGATWTALDYPGATELTAAMGIDGNNIVGTADTDTGEYGFLYDGKTWTTLLYPGARWTSIYDIDGNRIVGVYVDADPGGHMFLLTIPEPATLLLLALGGLAVMRRRR